MIKIKKLLRNLVIIIILFFLFMRTQGLSLTPKAAYEKTERSLHYGPSEVVHIEDISEGKLILGKYDKWISCVTVERQLLFFWSVGSHSRGLEKDDTQPINYDAGLGKESYYFYGIISHKNTDKIEITLSNGEVYSQSDFHEDLFLITWKPDSIYDGWRGMVVKGYDNGGNVIFEEEI